MSKVQIQAAHPEFEQWTEQWPAIGDKKQPYLDHVIGLHHHLSFGCDFQIKFNFVEQSLEGINFFYSGPDPIDCRSRVAGTLTTAYGEPASQRPVIFSGQPRLEWHVANVTVDLDNWSANGFIISYSHTGAFEDDLCRRLSANMRAGSSCR